MSLDQDNGVPGLLGENRPEGLPSGANEIRDLLLYFGNAGYQGLRQIDVTRHSDTLVTLQRFAK